MRKLSQLIAIWQRVSSDFPAACKKGVKLLWERSGDYREGLKVATQRILQVYFETTDFCNASCTMCGSRWMRRPRQVMPMDIYQAGVEQLVSEKGQSVLLSAFGEPLLDPHIGERIAFARKFKGIPNVGFTTNGSLLTAGKYRMLAEAGLQNMAISIDGFHKETYERVRVGLSYERLEKNMWEVLKVHEALGRPITLKISSFTRESQKELNRSPLYKGSIDAGITVGIKWRVDNWGGLVSKVDGGLFLMDIPRRRGPCALLYDSSVLVLPDGRVTPCHCRDLEGDLYIGHLGKQSLGEIWRGELLQRLRKQQWDGIFTPPCGNCSGYVSIRLFFTRSFVRWVLDYDRTVPLDDRPKNHVIRSPFLEKGA